MIGTKDRRHRLRGSQSLVTHLRLWPSYFRKRNMEVGNAALAPTTICITFKFPSRSVVISDVAARRSAVNQPKHRHSSISLPSPYRIDAHDTKQPRLSLSTLRRRPLLPVRSPLHIRLFTREWALVVITTSVIFDLVIRRSLTSEGWSDSSLSSAGRGVAFEDPMTVVRRDKTPESEVSLM